jgi:hypothetical protein
MPMSSEERAAYVDAYQNHGNGKYLADDETYEEVVARDLATLAAAGVTKEQIGQRLRQLFQAFNTFLAHRDRGPQVIAPGISLWLQIWDLGYEACPYLPGVTSNIDWYVYAEGLQNGNKAYHPKTNPTVVSDMLPEMIEKLGFFEGQVFYGIDPVWAVAIWEKLKGVNLEPYVPKLEKRAWDGVRAFFQSWEGKKYDPETDNRFLGLHVPDEQLDLLYPIKELLAQAIHTEKITPHITGYVVPGDVDWKRDPFSDGYYSRLGDDRKNEYWGVVVADEDDKLPPDATLFSIPFDQYMSHFHKGDIHVIRVFPYTDKEVG